MATGGGKQPTFCTVGAQRMVRPMILHLYGSPPCGKGQDMWLQTAFHPKAIQGLYLPYPKLKTRLPPIGLLEGCDWMINRRRGLGIGLEEVPGRRKRAAAKLWRGGDG